MTVPINVRTAASWKEASQECLVSGSGWFRMPEREYRRAHPISQSDLGLVVNGSLAHLAYARAHPSMPTPAMALGSLTHSLVLEPDTLPNTYVELPDFTELHGHPNSKKHREAKALWHLENADRIGVTPEQMAAGRTMARRVREHPKAAALLEDGHAEVAAIWRHPHVGVWCKSLMDWINPQELLVDVKTTTNASYAVFQKTLFDRKYGYYRQAAFYWDAYTAIMGRPPRAFVFIVVENAPPHEVAVYAVDLDCLLLGRRDYMAPLYAYRDVMDLPPSEWPGYSIDVQTMTPPSHLLR